MGRPTDYTEDLAAEICSRIALGNSLRAVVQMDGMPSSRTIYNWFGKYDEFVQQYARAKEDSADSRADQIEEIGDKVLTGEYDPAAARVAIDAFKWTSGKHKPKKYGDKQQIETTHTFSQMTDDEINNRVKALENELNS
tara:strand:- start:1435 stop:1851 length:417 start_codon:yes stop_codon:yes gene_type:complete